MTDFDTDDLPDDPFSPTAGAGDSGDPAARDAGGQRLGGGVLDRFKNTEPNRPLDDVGDLDSIRQDYARYGLRGVEKFAGADDAWAGVDLLKFALGAVLDLGDRASDGDDSDTTNVEGVDAVDGEDW